MDEPEDTPDDADQEEELGRLIDLEQWSGLRARQLRHWGDPLSPTEEARLWDLAVSITLDTVGVGRGLGLHPDACRAVEFLALGVDDALQGALPRPFRQKRPDRRMVGSELHGVEAACAYIALAKKKLIPDRQYIKTVSDLFDRERSTVQKWARRHTSLEVVQLLENHLTGLEAASVEALPEARLKAARYWLDDAARKYRGGGI